MQPDNNGVFNALPPVVWLLALPIIAMEIVLSAGAVEAIGGPGGVGWRIAAIEDYGVSAIVVQWMLETGQWPAAHLIRFLAYPFVHYSLTQSLFSLVFLLALGNMVGRIFAGWAVAVLFFGASLGGALAYGLLADDRFILAGAYPAAYGLIGAYTFILWVNLAATGGPRAQAFTLIGFLMGIQLTFAVIFGSRPDWIADLAGFATGFGLSFLVCPGGWSRVRDRIRHR